MSIYQLKDAANRQRRAASIALAALVVFSAQCGPLSGASSENDAQNLVLGLMAMSMSACAAYSDTPVNNPLFTGGVRTLYLVSACDPTGWANLGFSSSGTTRISTTPRTVTTSPFASFGTNVEVSFTVTEANGTLDVMAYGTGTFPGASTTNPTSRLAAGAACAVQVRHSGTGALNNMATCTDGAVLSAGQSYTYCLDFNRGTGSAGGYTGFGNMLAAWSRPCDQVAQADRDQMGDIRLMQMMNIPTMNPGNSQNIGFHSSGIQLNSFRAGNTIYASMM